MRGRYLEFLDHNLRETCTNWSERDDDCAVQQIDACGLTLAFALRALVDEEPMAFGEASASTTATCARAIRDRSSSATTLGAHIASTRACCSPTRQVGCARRKDHDATRVSHVFALIPLQRQTAG